MNHLFDDALNAAWNDLATGNDSGVSAGIDPADAALLRSMHNTAAGIEPDPAFREQLWVDLSRRPAIPAPSPMVSPSLPVSAAHQMEDAAMTPRLGTTSRRWSPPIATIAAALVIILVGYGALSLSGASPSGLHLDLNEVPNASAQGQGQELSDNPVIGTWVVWANVFSNTNSVSTLMHFESDGTLIADIAGLAQGNGTWSTDEQGRIAFRYATFPDFDQFDDRYDAEAPALPNLYQVAGSFQISEDGSTWIEQQWGGTTIGIDQHGQPITASYDDVAEAGLQPGIAYHSPERLDDLIGRSQNATDEQRIWLEGSGQALDENADSSAGPDVTAPHPSTQAVQVTVTPVPTSLRPTPTVNPEAQATVYVQATMRAESALPTETPVAQIIPIEQATVTPIATMAP